MLRQIPNAICLLRMALTPVCFWLITGMEFRLGLVVFCVAGATDFFDGYLARRMNWGSAAGAYLDPVADKVLLAGAYVALGVAGAVPWWVVLLIFGRDLMILIGAGVVYRKTGQRTFPPTMAGKVSTVFQIFAAVGVMGARAGILPEAVIPVVVGVTAAGTAYSGVDYVRRGWRMLKGGESGRERAD